MRGKDSRERSVSGDFDDSDFESHNGDGTSAPGKPGRKKNPNSQAARRDQNRIAQREFRLRKQQRIRDLEARVEILSGGKDEALGEMRNMLKDLMEENQTLRGLLRSLAGFIGDGAGGLLPKLGWDMGDFTQFINRSETDTAWEGYQARKKAAEATVGQKRPADDESSGSRAKKARNGDGDAERQSGFNLLVPMGAPPLSNSIYPNGSRPHEGNGGMLSDLMRTSSESPMYMQQQSPASNSYGGSNVTPYTQPYMPSLNMDPMPFTPPSTGTVSTQQSMPQQQQNRSGSLEPLDEDDDPNKAEAYKLIHYHLDNYKRNNQYCLPSSLRPSIVQRTIPHESVIDGILHAELRDRMILLRNRYDLVECLVDYRRSVTIHGDDVLAHGNWEIGEKFLRQYGFVLHSSKNLS